MRRGGIVLGLVCLWPVIAGGVVLDRVRVRAKPEAAVELSLSGPVVPWVRRLAATPDAPHRIYVDLADTTLGPGVHRLLSSSVPGLSRVRAGQFTPTTARIVLDMTAELSFEVDASEQRVLLRLGTPPPTPPVPVPPASTPPAVSSPAPARDDQPPAADAALPLVVVDAGHGGHDPGAEGIDGIQEKTVVLQVAHRLAAKLPARLPVDSLLTRSDDSFVPLAERLPHRGRPNTVFLSLHANACDEPDPRGLEIFFGAPHGSRDAVRSKQLARYITRELRARLLRVRGRPRPGPFRVLTTNPSPSVLVELGYLTHQEDAARLRDPRYQELLTDALVAAVATFLQARPESTVHAGQTIVPSGNESRTTSARGSRNAGSS